VATIIHISVITWIAITTTITSHRHRVNRIHRVLHTRIILYTHTKLTHSPTADVISIMSASMVYVMSVRRSTAKYNSTPVTTQMRRTDVRAPNTSALYHPNGIDCVAGLEATHMAQSDIMKLAKSVRRCEASVAIAKLLDKYPPAWVHGILNILL